MHTSLHISDLSVGYGHYLVQEHLNLTAESGQMICLLGQNGCGKSTLLKTLANLLPAVSGSCLIRFKNTDENAVSNINNPDEKDLFSLTEKERAMLMSVVLTERMSADNTTVHDVVAMGRYPYSSFLGGLSDADEAIISDALAKTEMSQKRDAFFNELSDGEKQRCLIAKALSQQTDFILLDEPTAHLDLPNRIKILLLLRQLAHDTGRIVLISTHELDLALQTADTIWLMTPHKGVAVGTPSQLIQNGAFQAAFQDPHFRFVTDGTSLKVEVC